MNTIICTIGKDNKTAIPQIVRAISKFGHKPQKTIIDWDVKNENKGKVNIGDTVYILNQGVPGVKGENNSIIAKGKLDSLPIKRTGKGYSINIHLISWDSKLSKNQVPTRSVLGVLKKNKYSILKNKSFWTCSFSGQILDPQTAINVNHYYNIIRSNIMKPPIIPFVPKNNFPKTNFDEEDFQNGINTVKIGKIENGPIKRPSKNISDTSKPKWIRQKKYSQEALLNAKRKCENHTNHRTFTTRDKYPYMEAHHLIPMKCQGDFTNSIDIPENIICLCPNCHRMFHSGAMSLTKKLISKFFNLRDSELQTKRGVTIMLPKLLKYYNC